MASYIGTSWDSGETVYAVVTSQADKKRWNTATSALATHADVDWGNYDIPLTEISTTGDYYVLFPTAITTAGRYTVTFYEQAGGSPSLALDTKLAQALVIDWDGSSEVTLLSIDTSVDAISSGSTAITITVPVALDGTITIVRGDDYSNSDARALDWTTTSSGTWPTLTGATITFTANKAASNENSGDATLTVTGSVVQDTGANKKVRIELTSAQTDSLAIGSHGYKYDVQATLTSGRKVTLQRGTMTVLEDQTTS